jgi:anaerobic magnesium-protoporphyrin IX monomethyl ester cyclase
MTKKKVVLFNPRYKASDVALPISLIAVAGPLLENGYQVVLVDANLDPDWERRVRQETEDSLCLGVTLLTGPMVIDAAAAGQLMKRERPAVPVVFGGWHPSLLVEDTLRESFVDVIVRAQGEVTFLELCERLARGGCLEGLAGISRKANGRIVHHPERGYTDINQFPRKHFELIDLEAYFERTGTRWLQYYTSYGCPYSCTYCCNPSLYGRRFNPMDSRRVAEELKELVAAYRVEFVSFTDDDFTVNEKRIAELSRCLIEASVKVRWSAQARADQIARFKDETLAAMVASGLSHLFFGVETGSEKMLKLMDKREENRHALASAEKCARHGITSGFYTIFGYPGEAREDVLDTLRLLGELREINPQAEVYTNIFTPYPGTPAFNEAIKGGLPKPQRLVDWADFYPQQGALPWLSAEEKEFIHQVRYYIRTAFPNRLVGSRGELGVFDLRAVARRLARLRIKRNFYRFPLEFQAKRLLDRIRAPRLVEASVNG